MKCGFERKMQTQQRYEWRNNNPLVLEHINGVHELTSRQRNQHGKSLKDERQATIKLERREQHDVNMVSIVDDNRV